MEKVKDQPRGEVTLCRADLHVHTEFSFDAVSSVKEVVDAARRAGIAVLAITDHESIEGALLAREYASKFSDLDIIIGEEINSGEGEILGLFLTRNIPAGLGIVDSIAEVRRQRGMVVIPHPFFWVTLKQTITVRKFKQLFDDVDAIEVMNASAAGRYAKRKRIRVNEEIFQLPEVGSSDAHHADYVGKAYTLFPGASAEDFRRALMKKQTIPAGEHLTHRDDLFLVKNLVQKKGRGYLKRTKGRLKDYLA